MKKFLTMFAFVATIVLGAFTIASCGDDDNLDPANVKYKFTLVAKLHTSKSEYEAVVKEEEKQINASVSNYAKQELASSMTEGDASLIWWNTINKFDEKHQAVVEEGCEKYKDKEYTLTITMLKDGKEEFKTKTYSTKNYFWDF